MSTQFCQVKTLKRDKKMRSPVLLIASGAQEIGKSYQSLLQALHLAYIAQSRRPTLLFDSSNEYSAYEIEGVTHKIQAIPHAGLTAFSNQRNADVKRLTPFHPNGAPLEPHETEGLVMRALKEFRPVLGGTLILEDMSNIFGDSLPDAVTGALCTLRHRNCDCIIHLQSIGRVTPKLRQNAKIIRYHYQIDSIADSKDKLTTEYEIFAIVERLVNKQFYSGNKYFHVYVYRMVKRVKGQFSERMFAEAIEEYIYDHPSCTSILEKRRSPNGKKLYTYEEAVKIKKHELFNKYYGNNMEM